MPNKKAPHQAVVNVKCEIYERHPDGRCMARPTSKESKLLTFTGKDYDEVKSKVDQFMENLNDQKTEKHSS